MTFELASLTPAIPEIFLALSGMLFLMIGVFRKEDSTQLLSWLGVAAMAVTGYLIIRGPETALTFQDLFIVNGFTSFAKILVLIGAALTLLMINSWAQVAKTARFELPILVVFATLGMMMMVSANDLISVYLGLELQSLSLYVLAAYHRDNTRSTEAGVKYFVLGALASGLLLYGSSLVYGFGGTTAFAGLAAAMHGGEAHLGVVIGIVFVIAGLAFKVSAVPFHMWTPDVYEGAPTPITAFFSVGPKIAALCLFLRILVGPFAPMIEQWQQVIVLISILSMLWGSFAAIAQKNIKRLMAYSSIGHVGYALIGLVVGNEEGARGLLFYLLIYLFMNIGTFAVILSMRVNGKYVEEISDLSGLQKNHPGMAMALAALMFSMAGIPPLAGFLGKYFIFVAAVNAGFVPLAIIGLLASVVGAFYYIRIIKVIYFDEPGAAFDKPDAVNSAIMGVCAALMLVYFVVPSKLVEGAASAARALFLG
ncbi:MAG: NADH-quinone oxidoreductase subunit NuoN [Proteobacteria bacterium]|nr:NADH-quinone oxidoreductase subunit NuoN [Pseudomonadota bacterium]